MKLSVDQVFDRLRDEREYQDSFVDKYSHKGNPSVEAEILMMEEYLALARSAWVKTKGDDAALDILRKVAGIAIRCFENHGCPARCFLKPTVTEQNITDHSAVFDKTDHSAVFDKTERFSPVDTPGVVGVVIRKDNTFYPVYCKSPSGTTETLNFTFAALEVVQKDGAFYCGNSGCGICLSK